MALRRRRSSRAGAVGGMGACSTSYSGHDEASWRFFSPARICRRGFMYADGVGSSSRTHGMPSCAVAANDERDECLEFEHLRKEEMRVRASVDGPVATTSVALKMRWLNNVGDAHGALASSYRRSWLSRARVAVAPISPALPREGIGRSLRARIVARRRREIIIPAYRNISFVVTKRRIVERDSTRASRRPENQSRRSNRFPAGVPARRHSRLLASTRITARCAKSPSARLDVAARSREAWRRSFRRHRVILMPPISPGMAPIVAFHHHG